ncbi:MAG: hypothetical protein GX418_06880 [Clostridiales bacterium]|nr:hypothetical protein [Clostridiales bacterium]
MSDNARPGPGRMWIRLMRGHRALRDLLVPCRADEPLEALREAMHTLDLSMPVWLPRHQADWGSFALTRFLPEHFMDSVDFERMEVSYIAPDEERNPHRAKA